jgi:hypothetical protein
MYYDILLQALSENKTPPGGFVERLMSGYLNCLH